MIDLVRKDHGSALVSRANAFNGLFDNTFHFLGAIHYSTTKNGSMAGQRDARRFFQRTGVPRVPCLYCCANGNRMA